MTDFMFSFLFCMADVYMLYRFCKSMFSRRYQGKWFVLWLFGVAILTFCVNIVEKLWVNILFLPILYLCAAMIEFRISWKNAIVYILIYYVMAAGGECVMEIVYSILEVRWYSDPDFYLSGNTLPAKSVTLNLFVPAYLFRFGVLLFIERYIRKLKVERSQDFAWYLLIIPMSSFFVFINHLYFHLVKEPYIQLLICIGTITLYFSCAVMFIIMERYGAVLNKVKEEELIAVKRQLEDERIKELEVWNEKYRCYMHDVHAIYRNVRMLAAEGDCEAVIRVIDEIENEQQLGEHNGNAIQSLAGGSVLSAIFMDKQEKAKRSGVSLEVFIEQFLKTDFIRETDMISMFGNLLDNAIEAAMQCEVGKRSVSVKLFMGNPCMLVFYMENTYAVPLQYCRGQLITTKSGSGHGLGIGIVQRLAEKYGGSLELEMNVEKVITTLAISAKSGSL